jgi:phosphatidylglycerol:prolipoprotein diacylglycerol transferase
MTPMVYAPGRFALDFLRNEDLGHSDVRYFGLTPAQYGCMVILVAGFFVLRRAKRYPPWPEPGTKPFVDPEETGP